MSSFSISKLAIVSYMYYFIQWFENTEQKISTQVGRIHLTVVIFESWNVKLLTVAFCK